MPYPNEHSARVRDPALFLPDSFVRKDISDGISVILGRLLSDPEGSLVIQAYRFDAEKFSAEQAQQWLQEHNVEYIEFHAAEKDNKSQNFVNEKNDKTEIQRRNVETLISLSPSEKATPIFSGYAVVYEVPSSPFGVDNRFFERIKRGAFSDSLRSNIDVRALYNHDSNYVLGRKSNQTLLLTEDDNGVHATIYPPPVSYVNDLVELVRRGYVNQMSFSFRVLQQDKKIENGKIFFEVSQAELYDVSIVTLPAYVQTSVDVVYRCARGGLPASVVKRHLEIRKLKV